MQCFIGIRSEILKAFSIYGKDWKKYVNVELWNGYMMA
jgi:hypothetical protein